MINSKKTFFAPYHSKLLNFEISWPLYTYKYILSINKQIIVFEFFELRFKIMMINHNLDMSIVMMNFLKNITFFITNFIKIMYQNTFKI